MSTSSTAGTGALLRAALRRDRVLLPVWVGLLVLMVFVSAIAIVDLYPNAAERIAAAKVINTSPALVALYGPILNESSLGELAMSKMTVMYALFVMGMALVIVRRHTRTEEETGRAELIGSTLVGRTAGLRAALAEATMASVLVGLLGAVANIAGGLDATGSVAFGLSWVGAGLVGTGIAAVCCQLTPSTRACGALAMAVIAALYLLRAVGDTPASTFTALEVFGWVSPLGWGTRLNAWGQPRWWVLGLYLMLATVLVVLAFVLHARRDLGGGLLPERPGRADGTVGSVPALVWRLNRTATLWWLAATVVWGALFGSVAPHLGDLFESEAGQAVLEQLGGAGVLQETMLAALLAIMSAFLAAYAAQMVTFAGHEETDGRAAVLHAAHGSRAAIFGAVLGLALLGTTALTLAYAVGSAIGFGSQVDGVWPALSSLVPAGLAHLPAIWVVASLAVLAWTIAARWVWLGWAFLALFITVGELGSLLKLPAWVMKLSPFQHVANVPAEAVNWGSEAALLGITVVVLVVAWLRYRSRDLA